MSNNEADGVDQRTPRGVTLSVANRMSLLLLAMTAMAAYSEVAVADEVSDTKAAVDIVMCETEVPLSFPGKLHAAYLEKIKAIQSSLEVDENFLRNSNLSSIRYNPRLFYPKQEGEQPEEEILNLKDETVRRLRSYSIQSGDWFVLDFKKIGSDKKAKLTHENNIQLGDILVDADIKSLLIQRADGSNINVTRGVGSDGGYKGRVGFLDVKGRFVPVFSGDKFRILSNVETVECEDGHMMGDYFELLNFENQNRAEHKRYYQTQKGSAATFTSKEDALKATKKLSYNPNDIKVPTLGMIEEAKKELKKGKSADAIKNYYLALGKENFMEIVKYCAAEAGVPIELILTVIKKESGFTLGIVGDHGAAIGLGQLHEPVFKFVRAKPRFGEIMARFTDKPANEIRRSDSVLVDVLSVAMLLRTDLNANKIEADLRTHLTLQQIAYTRYHYHVPGIFRKNKERGFNKRRGGYERFAREVLMVREILDGLSGEGIPET